MRLSAAAVALALLTQSCASPGTIPSSHDLGSLTPEFRITITRDGSQVYLQATGQPRFPLYAESENSFFLRVVEAQVAFTRGPDGKATMLTLHQGGASTPGQRVR